jgi:hypothetical protein
LAGTSCAVTARARFVTKPKSDALAAQFAHQAIQGRRRVGNPAVFSHLTAQAALGHRHHDPLLVNIKTDIRDTIPTIRVLCMSLGTGQSGATLVTCIL